VSARQAVDESVGWPNLPCCPYRHKVSVPCPPSGVWLVLTLCRRCDPKTEIYCGEHRATNWWLSTMSSAGREVPDLIGPPGVDVRQRAAGDREAGA
jgi:hypothetical protein